MFSGLCTNDVMQFLRIWNLRLRLDRFQGVFECFEDFVYDFDSKFDLHFEICLVFGLL